MRQYLVVAHKTLGGPELMEHLHHLREQDPYCRFHIIVPEQHSSDHAWTEGEARAAAQRTLDEVLERMAMLEMGATGEVGDSNPVYAVGVAVGRDGLDTYTGIVISTLPRGISRWWKFDVPRRLANAFPALEVTHVVSEEALVS